VANVPPAAEEIRQILRGVIDPELGSDIVELGMVRTVAVEDDGQVVITIALTTAGCPLRAQIQRDIKTRVTSIPGVVDVRLEWDAMTDEERASARKRLSS
jgi:ATP-binding protein involved in chromosome partitioning